MTDGDALHAAILAHPGEDTPRLMYADWLQENGQPARAAFIRHMIDPNAKHKRRLSWGGYPRSVPTVGFFVPDARAWGLWPYHVPGNFTVRYRVCDRAFVLTARHRPDTDILPSTATVRRGFVEAVRLTADGWLGLGDHLAAAYPITRVGLTTQPEFNLRSNIAEALGWFRARWPRVTFTVLA